MRFDCSSWFKPSSGIFSILYTKLFTLLTNSWPVSPKALPPASNASVVLLNSSVIFRLKSSSNCATCVLLLLVPGILIPKKVACCLTSA